MYRLNVCLLSGIFEKSFALCNFTRDYTVLLGELNATVDGANNYRLFCKLSHFFDDFNFFINESIRTRTEHDSKHSVDRRLRDFIQRVESMKIPHHIQDTITVFLKVQRTKAALVATRGDSWLVPKLLPQGDLNILRSEARDRNEEVRKRLIMTIQILQTWGKFPELRLGQLLSNSIPEGTDIFYVPDAKLIQLLKDFEVKHG